MTILYYAHANGRSVSQGDGLRRRRLCDAHARNSCSGRLADDRPMSRLKAKQVIVGHTTMLNADGGRKPAADD